MLAEFFVDIFGPAWKNSNFDKASKAVNAMTDQATLTRVAFNSQDERIRDIAMRKITDQEVLVQLAINEKSYHNGIVAVELLTDQRAILNVYKTARNEMIRRRAISTLTEKDFLTSISKSNDEVHRKIAKTTIARLLTDQNELMKIIETENDSTVCSTAISNLTDEKKLRQIIEYDSEKYLKSTVNWDESRTWEPEAYDMRETARKRLDELRRK